MKHIDSPGRFSAAVLAAGALVPGFAQAQNIPLGDSGFEDFVVPTIPGYAYSNTYRPTSAWVDDLDSPGPPNYIQDDGSSNWLYRAAYAEAAATGRRPAP